MEQPSPQAGYFGKLPRFGDFIRQNAGGPEFTALEQWLQEGLLAAKNRLASDWDGVYQQAPTYRFLFYPENAEHLLAGVLQKSQDKSERKYPFLVSIKIGRGQVQNDWLPFAPLLLADFYESAESFLHEINAGNKIQETLAQIDSLNFSPPSNWAAAIVSQQHRLHLMTTEQLWTAVLGAFDNPIKFLIIKNLSEILLPWRGRTPMRLSLGLRFPLGMAGAMAPMLASFWLQLCWRFLPNSALATSYFWTAATANQPAYFFLFFRRPAGSAFVSLVQPDFKNDNLCALELEGQEKLEATVNDLPANWRTLLENRNLSWQDFLQSL